MAIKPYVSKAPTQQLPCSTWLSLLYVQIPFPYYMALQCYCSPMISRSSSPGSVASCSLRSLKMSIRPCTSPKMSAASCVGPNSTVHTGVMRHVVCVSTNVYTHTHTHTRARARRERESQTQSPVEHMLPHISEYAPSLYAPTPTSAPRIVCVCVCLCTHRHGRVADALILPVPLSTSATPSWTLINNEVIHLITISCKHTHTHTHTRRHVAKPHGLTRVPM